MVLKVIMSYLEINEERKLQEINLKDKKVSRNYKTKKNKIKRQIMRDY